MKIIERLEPCHIEQLHQLYRQEWWTRERTLEETRRVVTHSQINLGLIDQYDTLRGYARILTDYTFKALIFDFIISETQRGEGWGDVLMEAIIMHPDLQPVPTLELYCLPEMFPYYERFGFTSEVGGVALMRYQGKYSKGFEVK